MLLAPFLNCIIEIDRRKLQLSLFILFFLLCIETMIRPMIDDWMSWILWFSYLYVCVGYYKKYIYGNEVVKKWILLIIGVSVYLLMCLVLIYCKLDNRIPSFAGNLIHRYLHEIFVAPNILVAASVFLFFIQLKQPLFKNKKTLEIVNAIAKPTFSVYIFHQVPGFYEFLWMSVLKCYLWINTSWYPIGLILIVVILYAVVGVVDFLIRIPMEKKWIRSHLFIKVKEILNDLYQDYI